MNLVGSTLVAQKFVDGTDAEASDTVAAAAAAAVTDAAVAAVDDMSESRVDADMRHRRSLNWIEAAVELVEASHRRNNGASPS